MKIKNKLLKVNPSDVFVTFLALLAFTGFIIIPVYEDLGTKGLKMILICFLLTFIIISCFHLWNNWYQRNKNMYLFRK